MEKKSNLIIIGLLVLIVGFGGGYLIRGNQAPEAGEHMMQGGMMMSNGTMGMQSAMDGMMMGR